MRNFAGELQVDLGVAVLEQTMSPKEDVYKRPVNQRSVVIVDNDLFVEDVLNEQHKARAGHSRDKTKQWKSTKDTILWPWSIQRKKGLLNTRTQYCYCTKIKHKRANF